MSANPDGGDFFNKEWVKNTAFNNQNITKYDDILDGFGEDSNRLVTDILTLHSVDPTALSAEQTESAENIANRNVLCLWYGRQKDFDSANHWEKKRDQAKDALIALLDADPANDRNATVAVSSSYRTSPLNSGLT
jgi:hypothetical protein